MHRLLCVFTLLLLTSASAHAEMPDVQECAVEGDCAMIEAECAGHFEAVNIHHKERQEAENLEKRRIIKCNAKIPPENISGVACFQNKCTLIREKM